MAMTGYPPPPAGVANNATEQRGWGSGWPNCQTSKIVRVVLSNGVVIHVRREIALLIVLLLNECIRRGYAIRQKDTGAYNCRAIAGTTVPSNHSWGLAVDINWNSNPMGRSVTDIPVWMVSLLWSFGFYWGGWYSGSGIDTMHFEYVRTPAQSITDTERALELYGGEDVERHQEALLYNASSVVGHIGLMDDTAPTRVWTGDPAKHNTPGPALNLPLVQAVRAIKAGVATLVERSEPTELPEVVVGEFSLSEADVERIATRVAELLAARLAD